MKERNKDVGAIGETAVKLDALKRGFEVYEGSGKSSVDAVILNTRNNKMVRVEVKTTRRRNKGDNGWVFNLRSSYLYKPFDKTKVEYVAVYIEPKNTLLYLPSSIIRAKFNMSIPDKDLQEFIDKYSAPMIA